MVDVFKLV